MPDVSSTIKYWIRQNDEYPMYYRDGGGRTGAWVRFLEELTGTYGWETELVTERGGQEISASEALDMLACGELDMVLGMPKEMWVKSAGQPEAGGAGSRMWTASEGIYGSELTGYIQKGSPQAGTMDFENCYWAIDSALKDMLDGTPFDGHTVDYEDRAQLYEALGNGDVYGVLDTRGGLDYEAFIGRKYDWRQCTAVCIPYTECAYVRAGDGELLEAVNGACERTAEYCGAWLGAESGGSEKATGETLERGYTNLLADSYAEASTFRTATYALGGAALVLAVVCATLSDRLRSQRSLEEAKLRTVLAEDASKELLELDLRKGTLRSYNDFAIFGERGRDIPNPVRLPELSELMGYDFVAHYGSVSAHISRKYSNRLIIHVGGEKLYITEEGVRTGHILVLTMTKM